MMETTIDVYDRLYFREDHVTIIQVIFETL